MALSSRSWRPFGPTYHTANQFHQCDRCMWPIEPGDAYERFAERRGRQILVTKYHHSPDCPPPWEMPEEETRETAVVYEFKKAA